MAKPHPMRQRLETERFVLRPLGRIEAFRIGRSNWNHDPEIMRNVIYSSKPLNPWRWLRKMVWVNRKTKFSHAIMPKDGGAPLREAHAIYPVDKRTGGPARYFAVEDSPVTLGLITPLSDNFCATCNRIRLTVEGRVYMCLGQDDHVDLRAALREDGDVDGLIDAALAGKPRAHDFHIERESKPAVARHMSATGG